MELNSPLIKNDFQRRRCGFKRRCSSLIALAIAITSILCMATQTWIKVTTINDPPNHCRNEHKFYIFCSTVLAIQGIILITNEL